MQEQEPQALEHLLAELPAQAQTQAASLVQQELEASQVDSPLQQEGLDSALCSLHR